MASPVNSTVSTVTKAKFDDRAQILDLLNSQKHITSSYNTFLNECETPAVKNCFSNILNDEHAMQGELFTDMQSRGWYQTNSADASKVNQAVNKFSADVSK